MAFLPFAPQLALGALETGVSLAQLQKLSKEELPKYDLSPTQANVSMYQQRLAEGLPAAEIAAMEQEQAAQNAGAYRQATELSGGQLSSAIGRIGQLQNINLAIRRGQMQAQERRAAQSGLAASRSALQGQKNLQTQYDMRRRESREQALGGSLRAGLTGMGEALTYGAFDYLGGMANVGSTPETASVMQQSVANVTPANYNFYPSAPTLEKFDVYNTPRFNTPVDFNAGYNPKSILFRK